jgi:hypothetical protein
MKTVSILLMALVAATMLSVGAMAGMQTSPGPAPSAGDGIPEGPGWGEEYPHPGDDATGPGPAPNAGDGIPDGPGW